VIESRAKPTVSATDLMRLGLTGTREAALRRHAVAAKLSLPPSNAKTFLTWLTMFDISMTQLTEACS
jgi:hypothetical protein